MYYSKKLDASFQFFNYFLFYHNYDKYVDFCHSIFPVKKLPKHMYRRYESKINALSQEFGSIYGVRFPKLEPTLEDQVEILNLIFGEHVDRFFKDQIYFYDELKPIILDDCNSIRNFDASMFRMLQYYTAKFNVIDIEATIAVSKHTRKIQEGAYSEGVKKLTKAYMHESRV